MPSVRQLAVAAPFLFLLHVLEEGPGFVAWFNSRVSPGITSDLFWRVNLAGLALTTSISALVWVIPFRFTSILLFAWLSFLFAGNALLHLTATVAGGAYMPGVVTAVLLYLPAYALLAIELHRTERFPVPALILVALLGSAPMLWHGYLIVFRGSRLF